MSEVFDAFRADLLQMIDDDSIWARCDEFFSRFDLPLDHLWGERCEGVIGSIVSFLIREVWLW